MGHERILRLQHAGRHLPGTERIGAGQEPDRPVHGREHATAALFMEKGGQAVQRPLVCFQRQVYGQGGEGEEEERQQGPGHCRGAVPLVARNHAVRVKHVTCGD